MKTVMKKLLSVMLVALLLVSAVPFQADAAEAVGYKYTVVIDGYAMEVVDDNGTVTAAELYNFLELSQGDDATIDAWIASKAPVDVKSGNVALTVPASQPETPETPEIPEQGGEGQPQPGVGGEGQPQPSVTKCELTVDYRLSGTAVQTVNAKVGDLYKKYVGVPARNGYDFQGWYSSNYGKIIDITKDIIQGDDTLTAVWSAPGEYFLTLDPNRGLAEDVNYGVKVTYGSKIYDQVMQYQPEREGYVFMGWKLNGKMIDKNTVYDLPDNATAYAVWKLESDTEDEPMNGGIHTKDGKVYLEIYTDGNTKTAKKVVDITKFADDDKITRAEVESVVKQYVTPKAGYSLAYVGLFNEETWFEYTHDDETDGKNSIVVNRDGDDYVYVMVNNVKTVAADPSNPQTGDMIGVSLALMMSTGGAALMLGKKRK